MLICGKIYTYYFKEQFYDTENDVGGQRILSFGS